MIAVRVRHWQKLSWNCHLCTCSLKSLNQHLYSQQLQPLYHDPYQSLPIWDILWFYDHLCPIIEYPLPSGLTCQYGGWITFTLSGWMYSMTLKFENEYINVSAIPWSLTGIIQHQLFKKNKIKRSPQKIMLSFPKSISIQVAYVPLLLLQWKKPSQKSKTI